MIFFQFFSKIHEKNPKKHTPPKKKKTLFFGGGGVGSEMNKTRQHRRGVHQTCLFVVFFSSEIHFDTLVFKMMKILI